MMAISRAFLFRTRISAASKKMAENKMASRRPAGYIFCRALRARQKINIPQTADGRQVDYAPRHCVAWWQSGRWRC